VEPKKQLDELTTYQLKLHLWLCRIAMVQGDLEEDLEKHMALVSKPLGPLVRTLTLYSRGCGLKSQPVDQQSSHMVSFLNPHSQMLGEHLKVGHDHFLLHFQPSGLV
jgi:hypothetical protein